MKKLLILMLLGVLFVPMNGSAKADEVLYCQTELATGLYEENGTWKSGNHTMKRYTIKVVGDFEKNHRSFRRHRLSLQSANDFFTSNQNRLLRQVGRYFFTTKRLSSFNIQRRISLHT